jgi:phosphomannomutase
MPTDAVYQCPGDATAISRSIHLGRLATFYPACRDCEHRTDVGTLDKESVLRIAAVHNRAPADDGFTEEGFEGLAHNQIDGRTVRKFATAAGIAWLTAEAGASFPPKIVLAADGRPLTSELLAAASEGLRQTGCRVVEVEAVTAPALAQAVSDLDAAGGLFLGNPRSMPHAVGLRAWSRGAVPASAGGSLDAIRQAFLSGAPRPARTSGGLERFVAHTAYLARLRGFFHALRPLTLVVDTASSPLTQYVRQLTATTACRILAPRPQRSSDGGGHNPRPIKPAAAPRPDALRARRLAWLSEQVPMDGADFGIWIDGDGECCSVVDERGKVVSPDRLLAAVARLELAGQIGAAIVAEQATAPRSLAAIQAAGIGMTVAAPLRESMFRALCETGSTIGGGPSGRFWFACPLPTPDGLTMLAWLLGVLSRTDRPLSAVLDAG